MRVEAAVATLALAVPLAGCGSDEGDASALADACQAPAEADDPFGNAPAEDPSCQPEGETVDCESDTMAPGCPCLTGEHHECYSGAPETLGVGDCAGGQQACHSGVWSECEGEVAPRSERCNDLDDDCDGVVDEGARSPCGGCNPECTGAVWGGEALPFEASDGLALTEFGQLTLARRSRESSYVWVPNTGEATLSKIDADAAVEVARYRTADSPERSPERVAVDYRGDAFVVSSSASGRSSLVKVAASHGDCLQGGERSSQGPDDVRAFGQDDCVLFSSELGEVGGVARSLAIDGTQQLDGLHGGDAWVGMQNEERLLELDGSSGELLRSVELPGIAPYAAVFDPWGTLFVVDRDGRLARVEPWRDPPTVDVIEANLRCYALESLSSDARGVLAMTGFACENVVVFDPARETWRQVEAPGVLTTRGVVVTDNDAWVVHTAGKLSRVTLEPLEFTATFSLRDEALAPVESIGVSRDTRGRLWVVSSMGGPDERGVATRFEPERGSVTAQVPVGYLPRAQGDFAGGRVQTSFVSEASATQVFTGCGGGASGAEDASASASRWRQVHIGWLPGPDAEVVVEARHAATRRELDDAAFSTLGTLPADAAPFPVAFPDGGIVELRITLRAGGRLGAPRVDRVGLEYGCVGPD